MWNGVYKFSNSANLLGNIRNVCKKGALLNGTKLTTNFSVRLRGFQTTSQRRLAEVIDGKLIAAEIRQEIRSEIRSWVGQGNRPPHLSVVLVGTDAASSTYVRNKIRAAQSVGITSDNITRPVTTTQDELLEIIHGLNEDSSVDGILVQLPVPDHMSERVICNAIAPHKDVDGFHVVNVGRLCLDMYTMVPCTPLGVMELIRRTGIQTLGKNAVVCGRSKNVGMPIAMLMHADGIGETRAMDATTTICHRYTPQEQLKVFTKNADIVVVAAGIPDLITGDMIKEGACVIDIGINRVPDGKGKTRLVGDVDFKSVRQVASYITPVPGGVGPMTVAMLMKNTLLASKGEVIDEQLHSSSIWKLDNYQKGRRIPEDQ